MRGSTLWRGAVLALVAAFVGCTLVVSQDAAQCSSDRDCERFTWTTCVQGGCVPREAAALPPLDPNAPCTSTQDCSAIHPEQFWVCQSGRCTSLKSGDCGSVIGEYTADDVLLVGAMLPLYGTHKSTGIPMERALEFAARDDFAAGVPFGNGQTKHPVAVVLCDEVQDPVRAARYLAETLKVPAIIGPAMSAAFLPVATQVTIPDGVVLISPYSTTDLSTLGGKGLIWRTAPDARYEAAAMAQVVSTVFEPKIRALNGDTPISVSVVWKNDPDNVNLVSHLVPALKFNGVSAVANGSLYQSTTYGNPDNAGQDDTAQAVAALVQAKPDLVIVSGNTEAAGEIIKSLEGVLAMGDKRPFYLLSHGLRVAELLAVVNQRPKLGPRILITSPGSSDAVSSYLNIRYDFTDYPQTFGVAQTFDAYYMLSYALAAIRNTDVIGRDVEDGLDTILGFHSDAGRSIVTLEADQIDPAFALIRAGTPIQLHGTSGLLDFDPATGSSPSNVQTACIEQTAEPDSAAFQDALLGYDSASATLVGTLGNGCLD